MIVNVAIVQAPLNQKHAIMRFTKKGIDTDLRVDQAKERVN